MNKSSNDGGNKFPSKDNRKKGYKGKQRSRARRPDRTQDRSDVRTDRLSPLNDISWYNKNPALLESVARVPFPYRPGMHINLWNGAGAVTDDTIPGVMVIQWQPSIGITGTNNPTAPVNIAMREIFNRVRSEFSGSIEADPPDFLMYFMALDTIFAYIAKLKRIYRVINAYTPDNLLIPRGIMFALGFTSDQINELQADRMQLFNIINQLVHMTDKFVCPALFPVFNRHYWLSDNVYADTPSINAQMYLMDMVTGYKFGVTGSPAVGRLTSVGMGAANFALSGKVVDQMFALGRGLIDALSAWDDAFIISGYLRKTFSGSPSFMVDELRMDEKFEPVYVPEVLMQIENAHTAVQNGVSLGNLTVTQDVATNTVTETLSITTNAPKLGFVPYLSIRSDLPTTDMIVEASRLQNWLTADASDVIRGTELVRGIVMNSVQQEGALINVMQNNVSEDPPAIGMLVPLSTFDWHPFIYAALDTDLGPTYCGLFGDYHNLTTLTPKMVEEINRVCLYSEFNAFNF